MSSQTGKGGTAVIWSDQLTEFDGQINAKGAEKMLVSAILMKNLNLVSLSSILQKSQYKIQTKIESKADPPPPKALKSQSVSKSSVDPPPRRFMNKVVAS